MGNGGKRQLSDDHLLEEKEKEEILRVPVLGRRVNGYRPRPRESLPPPPPKKCGLSLTPAFQAGVYSLGSRLRAGNLGGEWQ